MPIKLTPRQIEVMELVVRGKTEVEVGLILEVSHATVHNTMGRIRRKLDASSKTLAVAKYLRPDLFKKP